MPAGAPDRSIDDVVAYATRMIAEQRERSRREDWVRTHITDRSTGEEREPDESVPDELDSDES